MTAASVRQTERETERGEASNYLVDVQSIWFLQLNALSANKMIPSCLLTANIMLQTGISVDIGLFRKNSNVS